jgi:hypothetical protein
MTILPIRGVRHLRRFQQIAQILARHGFGELLDLLGAAPVFPLARALRRRPSWALPSGCGWRWKNWAPPSSNWDRC